MKRWFALLIAGVSFSTLLCSTPGCRCVPGRWSATVSSTSYQFDLEHGRSASGGNSMDVYYDFEGRRMAIIYKGRSRAVLDFGKGMAYSISSRGCRGHGTRQKERAMCVPKEAEYLGKETLVGNVEIDLWKFPGVNSTVRSAVNRENCVPVFEEIFYKTKGYAEVESIKYTNLSVQTIDENVFKLPDDCSYFPPRFGSSKRYDPSY
ncbi:DgyrCDS11763 [Dimorphilus gyrociliatus]|uniref:DgyrCDS11763 n=1 Tax=Dimorphilus gyrociliatus TaxID=2664684 RepID=A0A7I8W4D0_9ANNE|nr:DgyrCDS11763 [Dimorphilus gyrociliatus]